MNIKIWNNYSKRINSTAQPSGGTTVSVELKDDTSIENPTFILLGQYPDISYVSAFGHYYFVEDRVIMTGNRTMVKCAIDLLATYKSNIGNTTALVARSTSSFNKYLRDDSVSTEVNKVSTARDAFSMPLGKTGCFILSVVNDVSSATGYVCNYIINATGLGEIARWLSGQGTYDTTWSDVETYLMMQFGDCFDCIRSLRWIPVDYDSAATVGGSFVVRIGKFNTTTTGYKVTTSDLVKDYTTIDLSDILPTDFRCASPYSSVDVFLPYYGLVSLPPEHCRGSVGIKYAIDVSVGDCLTTIYTTGTDDEKMLASIHYDIGVDVPIAQVGKNLAASISAGTGVVGSLLSGNINGLINSGIGLISAAASNGVSCKGSLGGRAFSDYTYVTAYVTVCVTTSPDDLATNYGRPLMEVVKINTLSGYVQTINASVSCDCTQAELAKINGMLNEGFFYE